MSNRDRVVCKLKRSLRRARHGCDGRAPPGGHHGGALEPQVGLEVLRYLANESLKWQLTNQQLRALLIATDLAKGDSSRPVAVGLLHAAGGCALRAAFVASCLRGALPPVDLRAVCFVRAMTDYLRHNTLYAAHTQISHTNPRLLLTARCG
ncbi:hypothetical protein EVAR_46757_1 [Eumeta japonica]|uniref:Uncharacterized protein n=1 Tax=Eumeta variegata TaxID=151549 RepID=A0A4C2AAA0_EUMVA|nr:hypothetical protein EVAR_46757_1 [Eumeta japonica]